MCKEDVRIKRRVYANPTVNRTTAAVATDPWLTANPNRAAVLVALVDGDVASTLTVRVETGSFGGPMLGVLSIFNPSVLFELERYGNAVTQAIFLRPLTASGQNLYVVEYTWLEDLEKL